MYNPNKVNINMKKVISSLAVMVLATGLFAGNGGGEEGTTLKIDILKSKVFWTGKKLTGEHTGTLMLKSGTIEVNEGVPVKLTAQLDMSTIVVTDIKDPGTNAKLLGHLKSEDFFSVVAHPTGTFEASSFEPIVGAEGRDANYKVKGTLTLKDIVQPVAFNAFISAKGNMLLSNAELKIDRTKWDIKYGSGSFFDDLGDKAIYDDIDLVLVISAGI
jgi:polyisoprenoid-binding protein YceI